MRKIRYRFINWLASVLKVDELIDWETYREVVPVKVTKNHPVLHDGLLLESKKYPGLIKDLNICKHGFYDEFIKNSAYTSSKPFYHYEEGDVKAGEPIQATVTINKHKNN